MMQAVEEVTKAAFLHRQALSVGVQSPKSAVARQVPAHSIRNKRVRYTGQIYEELYLPGRPPWRAKRVEADAVATALRTERMAIEQRMVIRERVKGVRLEEK